MVEVVECHKGKVVGSPIIVTVTIEPSKPAGLAGLAKGKNQVPFDEPGCCLFCY